MHLPARRLRVPRRLDGLESLEQIKYAVMQTSGGISIVPKEGARRG